MAKHMKRRHNIDVNLGLETNEELKTAAPEGDEIELLEGDDMEFEPEPRILRCLKPKQPQ
jgi:hypothetical protein